MRSIKASTYAIIALVGLLTLTASADERASDASTRELVALTGAGNLGVRARRTS
jgi:uncharacterized protein YggE